MIRSIAIASLLVILLYLPGAEAHKAWLLPSSSTVSHPQIVTVDAAVSNDLFFFNHVPLALDNLVITSPSGQKILPTHLHKGGLRSIFDVQLTEKGTYHLMVLNQGLIASYVQDGKPKRWRGTPERFVTEVPKNAEKLKLAQYLNRVETFITLGTPSAITSSDGISPDGNPAGTGLTVNMLTHPNDLVRGETARFRVLLDGKPLENAEVEIVQGGTRYRNHTEALQQTTGKEGEFSVTWPEAGMYWVEISHTDQKTTYPEAGERRLNYSTTLEVMPD